MRIMSTLAGWTLAALIVAGCGDEANRKDAKPGATPSNTAAPAPTPGAGATGGSQEPAKAASDWREQAKGAIAKGAAFLKGAAKDGKWTIQGKPDLGVSALAARALLGAPGHGPDDVRVTLDWLASAQQKDGGIYEKANAVYITAAGMMALQKANDPKYAPVVKNALEYLRIVQADEADGRTPSSEDYGGIGYGTRGDVNLSTTHFAIEAASEAGLPKSDDFYKKALMFLQRTQNRSESNPATHTLEDGTKVETGNDGGGIYRPGESKAGVQTLPDGRRIFRSYGSMTYALLKSYLLCDLDAKDARVKAALDWIGQNWVLDYNPGMEHAEAANDKDPKYQGLFYYYLTLARTLSAAERQGLDLGSVGLGSWRAQLVTKLAAEQKPDGSWINAQDRWFEGSPELVTAYAVLALEECLAGAR